MIKQSVFLLMTIFTMTLCFFEIRAEPIDLESHIQDYVLYTKQLNIPGYPDAYNPSIIRWRGDLLMSFRNTADPKRKYDSEIGVVWLDEDFNAISKPQILALNSLGDAPEVPPRAEDGRLVIVGESLYLIYDDNRDPVISRGGFRVFIAKLNVVDQLVKPEKIEKIVYFEGENPNIREKGWTPFDYENELFLAYSLSPLRVFRYLPGTKSCEMVTETYSKNDWKWGVLRGGTAASKMDEGYYLSFFHSSIEMTSVHSNNTKALHYFMGAYIFSPQPPFYIFGISPEPIVGKNFYHGKTYKPYHHPVCAVFPAGHICEGDTIYVVYGRQDHEIWVVALDKAGLLNSLIPVLLENHS